MKDHVAVLVPCYNESKTIEKVVRDFKRVLPEATVYVYDNNSSDGTGEIAARAGAVVRRERMQGKGSVIRRMFREIDADCYLMVDGDDTYPAEDAPAMVSAVLDGGYGGRRPTVQHLFHRKQAAVSQSGQRSGSREH